MKKTQDGRRPLDVTPVPKTPEQRGRDAMVMTPIPGQQTSNTQTAADGGAAATQPTSNQPTKTEMIGDVSGGRDALGMTLVPGNPLEKGRGTVPMVPVPTQVPKPAGGTPPPEKKK
jgi:hypothetical protein